MFTANQVFPGVYHITDALGCCMTLLCGGEKALLTDTGYGTEDVHAFVRTLTALPLTVVLTHAHYDHVLGSLYFEKVHMSAADLPYLEGYTDREHRERILRMALEANVKTDEAFFLGTPMPVPETIGKETFDLGCLSAQILPCAGHTPGSVMVYVPEYQLLLTGDNWNPCTWLFFPEAVPVREFRSNMRNALASLPYRYVLCPHRTQLYTRDMTEAFFEGLTDEKLIRARPESTGHYPLTDARHCDVTEDQFLVFDMGKFL